MSTIAYAIVCAVKLVNLFARRQHLIDTAATPIDVDSNFFCRILSRVPVSISPKM